VSEASFISAAESLTHWQGHRRLTRRVIDAFPDDKPFTFSLGGMRPFGDLAMELLSMAVPAVKGVLSGDWQMASREPLPKHELLRRWDENTEQLNKLFPQIPAARFAEKVTAFGQWPGIAHDVILYVIDNEIHHRGQGYVYLRALGIQPPAFYER
jgi:uncharacterized damage-inducible protein DinB